MNGKTPPYVPTHLAGKVRDFRQEPDGSISFADDESALGLGPEESRQNISQDQYQKTFDRGYRARNFNDSMKGQYMGSRQGPTSRGKQLNDWIAGALDSGYKWGTSSQGKAVGTVGLLSALAGGAAGAYLGNQQGEGAVSKGLLMALLAGTAGAGVTAFSQAQHNRREDWLAKQANNADIIIDAISRDYTMDPMLRADCLRAAARMSDIERENLARKMSMITGAGAGMLVVQFMRSKGLLPMLAGGMIGALAGYVAGPGMKYNSMGQLSLSNYR